jgi:hypothetical protein
MEIKMSGQYTEYTVTVLKSNKVLINVKVICPVCYQGFHIFKWGNVTCPNLLCGAKLKFEEGINP